MIPRLNENNLFRLPQTIILPEYNRSRIQSGMMHIGVGNFHRAHQAYYTDQLLKKGAVNWGICGVCLLDSDQEMYQTLRKQDGLYSLIVKEADGNQKVSIIGSIVDYLYAPADPEVVISKMADPGVKIISLTITEGGYNFDAASGKFIFSDPGIQWDLQHPDRPRTIFGYLTASLHLRKKKKMAGLTILSCDNIQHNGAVCKSMLMTYMRECFPDLAEWTEENVTFPNCMVDRITPRTSAQDIEDLRNNYGIEDSWPVICEPFIQWIIEDNFSQGRPDWEHEGVQFVQSVEPYEKMKIRLLNAGHSLLGFSGSLCGYRTIDETVRVDWISGFLREFMDKEVSPVLGTIEGIDQEEYKHSLIDRFANPYMGDQVSRICGESSSKIPKFLLPTIHDQLESAGPVLCSALIIASWCRYLELAGTKGSDYDIQDDMKDILIEKAKASVSDDPMAFLKIEPVFGDLAQSKSFVKIYLDMIAMVRKHGLEKAVRQVFII